VTQYSSREGVLEDMRGRGTRKSIRAEDVIMNQPLNDAVAVVTGASSGIGEALPIALAGSAPRVALIARRGDRLDELKDRVTASGGTAAAFVADVADREQAETAVQQVVTEFGRLDIVVNNAGLMRIGAAPSPTRRTGTRCCRSTCRGSSTSRGRPYRTSFARRPTRRAGWPTWSTSARRRAGWPVRERGLCVDQIRRRGRSPRRCARRCSVSGSGWGLVEPGTVQTEITTGLPPDDQETLDKLTAGMVKLEPADIADAVVYMVTRDRRVAVNEILVRSAEQTW
jgi:NADP-dependent 3-hydroxy acid dehydrogenase YdfG